ncbi:MAG: energy-coupling factor transporter transmembrane protein EcfT [Anaerolineae bacterium]|nr:energy-coupling factor transporter transmembrane protein EcfT [Anaerolineae bacterium]
MAANFDLYLRRDTAIHRLDPRVKLAFVVEATFLTLLWPRLEVTLAMIGICALGFWRARVPAARVGGILRVIGPLMGMVFVLTAIFGAREGAAIAAGPFAVTAASLARGALLALRLLALAFIVFLWLFTTDQTAIVRGFVALGVPYAWGLTLALALRYLPLFAALFEQVRDAQQARGLDLEQRSFVGRLRAYQPVLVAMIISALRNSEHLGWALEARAVGATGVRRSTFRPLRLQVADRIALALLGVAFVVGVALRLL